MKLLKVASLSFIFHFHSVHPVMFNEQSENIILSCYFMQLCQKEVLKEMGGWYYLQVPVFRSGRPDDHYCITTTNRLCPSVHLHLLQMNTRSIYVHCNLLVHSKYGIYWQKSLLFDFITDQFLSLFCFYIRLTGGAQICLLSGQASVPFAVIEK